eukprot:CAMPEP_0177628828 /NCGR_PEP_ID=MMETSP0447-20121125/340_1 /TAXON_ID=0 /ORGANISM="Stygamoeba regulata, Strain BSH-02190019" /LENGTH=363 /DNA_ID=CAMNT_0019130103 /DNA_START=79 /DNA_END=1170 /DNA_ORIENTATION=+
MSAPMSIPPTISAGTDNDTTSPSAETLHLGTSPTLRVPQVREGYSIRLMAGNANPKLANDLAAALNLQLEPCEVGAFADGEINIQIKNNVRGGDVYIIQPTCPPNVNQNLMELLLLMHTLILSSAKRITCVVPYFGYARQDRKTKPRVPISASAVAQLIEAVGPHRIVTVDLHCGQIQGFFHKTPVDNLFSDHQVHQWMESKNFDKSKVAIVSPDAGGVARARRIADQYGADSVITILKRRAMANVIESAQLVGDVQGLICIIVDDMIDTAGTLCSAAKLLIDKGATEVYACATHGLFSGPAIDRMNSSVLSEIVVTDSIPQEHNKARCPKLTVLSLVPLLAEVIKRLHNEKSLSSLFSDRLC